jgi:hypothetical protein
MADKAELIIRLRDEAGPGAMPLTRPSPSGSSAMESARASWFRDAQFARAGWDQPIMPAATMKDWRTSPPPIQRPMPVDQATLPGVKATTGLLALAKSALTAAAATAVIERAFSTFNAVLSHTRKTWEDLAQNRNTEVIINRDEWRKRVGYGAGFGTAGAIAGGMFGAPGGPPGIALGALAGGAAGTLVGVKIAEAFATAHRDFEKVSDALIARGRQIAPFSGQLTQAAAKADIRSLMADIRESQTIGPGLARLTEGRSRFETMLRDSFLSLKESQAELMGAQYEKLIQLIETGKFTAAELGSLKPDLSNLADLPNIKAALDKMPDRIADAQDRKKKENDLPLDRFMKLGDPRNPHGVPNYPDIREQALGVPAFDS